MTSARSRLAGAHHMIAALFLLLAGFYLAVGVLFAVPFALVGVNKIDSHSARGTWGFRLMIIPGTIALWPLLLRRWMSRVQEPPEEGSAHLLRARVDALPPSSTPRETK